MDFKQLEAFIKVIETGSFSKAAEELFVSQPSISTYIASLENELGVILINRSTKVLSITQAGEIFLQSAQKMLQLKKETADKLKNLAWDISGEIRILASSVPAQFILPPLLAEFHSLYPKITFTMSQADTADVVQGIGKHRADIGFVGSIPDEKKCVFHEFVDDRLVFIAASNDDYSDKEYALEELLYTNRFIAREQGSGTRMQYENFFTTHGIQLDKIKTCACMDSTQSIINAVYNGLGISIVSELAAGLKFKKNHLHQIRVNKKLPTRKIYIALNKNIIHSHSVKLFMEYILENYGGELQGHHT